MLVVPALNDLQVFGADIQNLEKNYMHRPKEFGDKEGTLFLVVRALYGLKSAAASLERSWFTRPSRVQLISC